MKRLYPNNWGAREIIEAERLAGPVLIIGASGFIGANLFFALNRHRDDIYAISANITNGWRFRGFCGDNIKNIDITENEKLEKFIREIQPKTIFNLTAYGGHSHQTDIDRIHQVNYLGTLNILRALSPIDYDAFVQAGSSSEYGLNSAAPGEKDELIPNSDYAVSKIGASYLIKYHGRVLDFPVMHLRFYSIYGPWQERRTLMPIFISKCLENKWPDLVRKEISHDFVFVDDCTNALVKAALRLYENVGFGKSINIATGVKTTMEDLTVAAKKVFKVTSEPKFGSIPNKAWDIENWYGNPELAFKLLGWKARTPLETGLALTAGWEKEFKKTV